MNVLRSDRFCRAEGATLSFFSVAETPPLVDADLISSLIFESEEAGFANARVCLHSSPDDTFHDMIILERRKAYFPPHRHFTKSETLHIIRGGLQVFTFTEEGEVSSFSLLMPSSGLVSRIAPQQWHFTLPMTDMVIYHEAKVGPFLGTQDREFAPWAPGRDDDPTEFIYRIFGR